MHGVLNSDGRADFGPVCGPNSTLYRLHAYSILTLYGPYTYSILTHTVLIPTLYGPYTDSIPTPDCSYRNLIPTIPIPSRTFDFCFCFASVGFSYLFGRPPGPGGAPPLRTILPVTPPARAAVFFYSGGWATSWGIVGFSSPTMHFQNHSYDNS